MDKIAIFIDGSNFAKSFRQLNIRPNYQKIKDYFSSKGNVVGCYYFTALPPAGVFSPLRSILDHIQYHGWSLITKETKTYEQEGKTITKGNMDVEIVVQAWEICEHIDHLVLFSGDGDFRSMVAKLQNRAVAVTAVSIHRPKEITSMIADELRRQVNHFIDLREIADIIKMDDAPKGETPTLKFLRGRKL